MERSEPVADSLDAIVLGRGDGDDVAALVAGAVDPAAWDEALAQR